MFIEKISIRLLLCLLVEKWELYQKQEIIKLCIDANGANKDYTIFGEHNKPWGTYDGMEDALTNSASNLRTIYTGGIGNILLVQSSQGAIFITSQGGFFIPSPDSATEKVHVFDNTVASYTNGVLTIEGQGKWGSVSTITHVHDALNRAPYTDTY